MTRTTPITLLAAAAAALLAAGSPAQDKDNVKRVDSAGGDGGLVYWEVRCRDGRSTRISLEDATTILCAQPRGKPARCEKAGEAWTVRLAAAHSCS